MPEAGVRECGGRVLQAEIGSPVTFSLECQHRVRASIHATADAAREMHAEKWKAEIGHGVQQAANQGFFFRNEIVVFATKWNDRDFGFFSRHAADAIAVQAGAVD